MATISGKTITVGRHCKHYNGELWEWPDEDFTVSKFCIGDKIRNTAPLCGGVEVGTEFVVLDFEYIYAFMVYVTNDNEFYGEGFFVPSTYVRTSW